MTNASKSNNLDSRLELALAKYAPALDLLEGEQRGLAKQVIVLVEKAGGRNKAATATGVSPTTLDNYRAGKTQPKFLDLLALCKAADVPLTDVMEDEELLGKNAVRAIVSRELYAGPEISGELLAEIGDMVAQLHSDAGIKLTDNNKFRLAAEGYNRITDHAEDQHDFELLRSLLPWLKVTFKRDIEAQAKKPGSGKRSA